jgi:hypothetical protein
MKIITNVGRGDALIRSIVALALIGLPLSGALHGVTAAVALLLAVVFIVTAGLTFCPLYSLLGINTCRTRQTR